MQRQANRPIQTAGRRASSPAAAARRIGQLPAATHVDASPPVFGACPRREIDAA